jgi:hypothetical protein
MQNPYKVIIAGIVPALHSLRATLVGQFAMHEWMLCVDITLVLLLVAISGYMWFWWLERVRDLSWKLIVIVLLLYVTVLATNVTLSMVAFFSDNHPDLHAAVVAALARQTAGFFTTAWPSATPAQ